MNKTLALLLMLTCTVVLAAQDQPTTDSKDRPDNLRRHRLHRPHRVPLKPDRPLTEGQLDQALEVMRRIDPPMADRLEQLRDQDPKAAIRMLERRFPKVRDLIFLGKRDPQMLEFRIEQLRLARSIRRLISRYRQARSENQAEQAERIEADLVESLEQRFDQQQGMRRAQIHKLEQRVEGLRHKLEEQSENKPRIIQQQLERIQNTKRVRSVGRRLQGPPQDLDSQTNRGRAPTRPESRQSD